MDIQYIPLGLAYISSVLKAGGHDVSVIDVRIENLSDEEVLRRVAAASPDLFCVTSATCQIFDASNLLRAVKERFPGIRTVIGGPHISALPELTLKQFPFIDIGVVGEGELTSLELADAISAGRDLSCVPGIVFRGKDGILLTAARPYIENLDTLPFPDRNAFPLEIYARNAIECKAKPVATMITSRGCPFGCCFCCKSTFGARYRARSAASVIEEIRHLVTGGYKEIHILDDNFSFDMARVRTICEAVIANKWNVNFVLPNGIHATRFDDDTAALMRRAGFYYLWFGVETGDPGLLESLRKGVTLEQVEKAVATAKKHGFFTGMFFVVGLPGATQETELRSVEFAKKCAPDVMGVSVFTPYPGSSVYAALAKSANWTSYRHDFAEKGFSGRNFDEKYILQQFDRVIVGFYSDPWYYIGLVRRHGLFGAKRIWISFKNFVFRRLGL